MEIDIYSKKYIHYYSGEILTLIKNIFNKYNIKIMADLGSGDGSILYSLSKNGYLDNMEKVIAVDISKERINNVKKINSKILCVVADVCNLGLRNNIHLDLIISTQVIEHVPDDRKLIEEVYRVLDKKGIFYLSTVFKKWYGWYFYRCNGKWVLDPTHLREYVDDNQLLCLFEKYNFEILENKKKLQWFPITDFIFKRIGVKRDIYNNKILKVFRNIKIPILGYYNWELVLKKRIYEYSKQNGIK
jgi:SAM-dependent methyltransferase